MALALHPTQRVVNVKWGGVVFIYAELQGNKLYYVRPGGQGDDAKPKIRTITLPESATQFGITGSTYAKVRKNDDDPGTPTFLVCGLRTTPHDIDDTEGNTVRVFDRSALIYLSNSGLKWQLARQQDAIISNYDNQPSLNVVALVWNRDSKSFYYDQLSSTIEPHSGEGTALDQIFQSSDGKSWSNSSSNETNRDSNYRSAFPSFCKDNDCKDKSGQNVPDGVMANSQKSFTVSPTTPPLTIYGQGLIGYTPGKNTVHIKRKTKDGTEEYDATVPGIGAITCVAGHSGALMAGGFVDKDDDSSAGAVALSTDAGRTWKHIDSTATGVVTMIAAPPAATSDS